MRQKLLALALTAGLAAAAPYSLAADSLFATARP